MSKQQAKQFIDALHHDEVLVNDLQDSLNVNHFKEVESEEHAKEVFKQYKDFASKNGYEFTAEEYAEAVKETDYVQEGQLSEKELERVSGGTAITEGVVLTIAVAATAAGAIGTAAGAAGLGGFLIGKYT